jgi:ribosomal protein S18 acetylase RimI-like enzyme
MTPTGPGVIVSRLGPDDAALAVETVRLLKAPDGYPIPSVAQLSSFLSREENVLIAAVDGGVPVGFVVAYLLDRIDREEPMMLFYEVGVAASHRRRGVGTRLVNKLKSICRVEDVMKMWVPTGRSNVAATRLYPSTGGVASSSEDEVTYTYPQETFMNLTEER